MVYTAFYPHAIVSQHSEVHVISKGNSEEGIIKMMRIVDKIALQSIYEKHGIITQLVNFYSAIIPLLCFLIIYILHIALYIFSKNIVICTMIQGQVLHCSEMIFLFALFPATREEMRAASRYPKRNAEMRVILISIMT